MAARTSLRAAPGERRTGGGTRPQRQLGLAGGRWVPATRCDTRSTLERVVLGARRGSGVWTWLTC
eukprot:scaffold1214_cov311-Pavlova_lutheri.AAC.4